jgi:hypothetical protein
MIEGGALYSMKVGEYDRQQTHLALAIVLWTGVIMMSFMLILA